MDVEETCAGPCNNRWREAQVAWRQALAEYDPLDSSQSRPEPPEIRPYPGDILNGGPQWCGRCATLVRNRLAQLDDLIALRKAPADGHSQATEAERVSGSAASPPSPSAAADDEDDATSMLTGWEDAYRELRGWPAPTGRGDLASVTTTCIAWLMRHFNGVIRAPFADEFGLNVLRYHRELTGPVKAGVRTVRKPLRCPSCQYATLMWTEGEQQVNCANPVCRRILSLADYEAEVERLAAEQKAAA